jgi:hypothetical protein
MKMVVTEGWGQGDRDKGAEEKGVGQIRGVGDIVFV